MSYLDVDAIENVSGLFREKISELQMEPEFQWSKDRLTYALDQKGEPEVKLAVGNVPLDYDLWRGLRNPAMLGLYPAGLRELWEFHANRRKKRVDETGRQTIFQVPRSFDYAKNIFSRAVIISVMLPFSHSINDEYSDQIVNGNSVSSHLFSRMYDDVNMMINKATSRVSIDLVNGDNVVLSMDNRTVGNVSEEAVPVTHQGDSHGPSKGGNYPQKSLAALMGLGQFGVSRLVFRDEVTEIGVKRFLGPLRSIVVFDSGEMINDGSGGVIYPSSEWREFLFELYDFTNTDPEVNRHRFCSYIPQDDEGCGKCIENCPSGAQRNSSPTTKGNYNSDVSEQRHRFWEGEVQFDFGRCCDDRGQMSGLYPEWSCALCATICASKGVRRSESVNRFYTKKRELTRE